ncbi:MAG TPA: imidazoleglycerol-phosphate dehydratase HisB [Candidatus Dormibacteraeota bacterium]|jgi:imidazoleglycerol-phosphate dehydratase|nr:imidazoleglycerol-phosphate dehydratase HisB [Candidatus Dormibacteraeota bacterium]
MSAPVRSAVRERNTRETQVRADVVVDGSGVAAIDVPLPFLRHMLEAFTKYSGMDISLRGAGDVDVDAHHLVEDCGLVLGAAIAEALGNRSGIRRFGDAHAPLDEALVRCVLDFSNRPFAVYEMAPLRGLINEFDVTLLGEFVRALAQTAGITLHLDYIRGENLHHIAEAGFKAMGLATRQALTRIGGGVPSTKGVL